MDTIIIFILILFILHDENRVAMTKAYLVDYVLKWLLALVHLFSSFLSYLIND